MKRWLLWTLRCRRGRGCGRLTVQALESGGLPSGHTAMIDYTCGSCGTEYRLEVFVAAGQLVELNRERRP